MRRPRAVDDLRSARPSRLARVLALFGLGVSLTGCLDYERITLHLDFHRGKGTWSAEFRYAGMHHSEVDACASAEVCLVALRAAVCGAARPGFEGGAEAEAHLELQPDGQVDLVHRERGDIATWAVTGESDGYRGSALLTPGRDAEPVKRFVFIVDPASAAVTVRKGKFERTSINLETGKRVEIWSLVSTRGSVDYELGRGEAKGEPTPPSELAWVDGIPGLREALLAQPPVCRAVDLPPEPGVAEGRE